MGPRLERRLSEYAKIRIVVSVWMLLFIVISHLAHTLRPSMGPLPTILVGAVIAAPLSFFGCGWVFRNAP
ncbi:hypothetical protein [Haladaptatus sp. CMSO5]|uniref:hypothetical protein n=1 Tax=Haladaptatus sp. CMSO5 TaxID=3120514 RepID=UPI002FCDFADD